MSTSKRLISASAASWFQISITITAQLALVPIYLSFWDVKTYGIWLAVQAFSGFISIIDKGHHYYLYFEFLKKNKEEKKEVSLMLGSGMRLALLSGLMQIIFALLIMLTGTIGNLFGDKISLNTNLLFQASILLVCQCVGWLFTGSITGLFGRVLALYDYYPRIAWWNAALSICTSIIPATAVAFGANLAWTGIITAIFTIIVNIPYTIDMIRLLIKEKISFNIFSWKIGYLNYFKSLAVTAKDILESIRQQSVRIILAPLLGTTVLAAFATMRTGANLFLQGLSTITNPLFPELMRFLKQRDQERSEAAFGTVWIVLIAILSPGVILVQGFIQPLFHIWTRGHIQFDPALFAILSMNVLIYGLGQPAIAVVVGNNLLRHQLFISILSGIVLIVSIFILVPGIGLMGAGIALMIAELTSTIGYKIIAKRWLINNGLLWPKQQYLIAISSVYIAAISMALIILFPKWFIVVLPVSLIISLLNFLKYWRTLPKIATQHAKRLLIKIPGLKKINCTYLK